MPRLTGARPPTQSLSRSRLVMRSVHPDVVEFEPSGASYRVKDDVRERILPEAARAPIEGDRKVIVLFEAERLRGNQNESANAMLKTLEEPPDRTVVVLVTGAPDDLLPTITSRCQRLWRSGILFPLMPRLMTIGAVAGCVTPR